MENESESMFNPGLNGMATVAVGRPFGGAYEPAPTGYRISVLENIHKVIIALPRPTAVETFALNHGRIRFALMTYKSAICVLVEIAGLTNGFVDLPILSTIVPPEYQNDLLPLSPEDSKRFHTLVSFFLIDSNNSVVEAMRACTLSPGMSSALREAMRLQEASGARQQQFSADLDELYARYPDGNSMVADCVAICYGGD